MTLVGAWLEHKTPYLIGDVLLHSVEEPNSEIDHAPLPTRKDVSTILPKSQEKRLAGLCQKIYKISDTFAVGWTGETFAAEKVIKGLFETFGGRAPSLQEVHSYLNNFTGLGESRCILVGWVAEGESCKCFEWDRDTPVKFAVDKSFIEGSGDDFLRDILRPSGESGSTPLVNSALGKLANLLGYEVINGSNLSCLFGAGYQLIYFNEGSFHVLPSATFIFMAVKEEDDGKTTVEAIQKFVKFNYENEILYVLDQHVDKDFNAYRGYQIAPSILTEPTTVVKENKALTFESDYYALYYNITFRDGVKGEYVSTFSDDMKAPHIRIEPADDGLELIRVNKKVITKVVEAMKNISPDQISKTRKCLVY